MICDVCRTWLLGNNTPSLSERLEAKFGALPQMNCDQFWDWQTEEEAEEMDQGFVREWLSARGVNQQPISGRETSDAEGNYTPDVIAKSAWEAMQWATEGDVDWSTLNAGFQECLMATVQSATRNVGSLDGMAWPEIAGAFYGTLYEFLGEDVPGFQTLPELERYGWEAFARHCMFLADAENADFATFEGQWRRWARRKMEGKRGCKQCGQPRWENEDYCMTCFDALTAVA